MGTTKVLAAVRTATAQIVRESEEEMTLGDLVRLARALGFKPSDLLDDSAATPVP